MKAEPQLFPVCIVQSCCRRGRRERLRAKKFCEPTCPHCSIKAWGKKKLCLLVAYSKAEVQKKRSLFRLLPVTFIGTGRFLCVELSYTPGTTVLFRSPVFEPTCRIFSRCSFLSHTLSLSLRPPQHLSHPRSALLSQGCITWRQPPTIFPASSSLCECVCAIRSSRYRVSQPCCPG